MTNPATPASASTSEKKYLRSTPVESTPDQSDQVSGADISTQDQSSSPQTQSSSSPQSNMTSSGEEKKGFSLWDDVISPAFCCCSRKDGYEEIGAETADVKSQQIQDLQNLYDMLNEQLQSVQSNGEMQRLLQERLVEQVHELDDVISNNKSQLLNEIQEVSEREMIGRSELKEAVLRYLEEERLKEIEDVLTGHSNNTDQMVEQLLGLRNRVVGIEDDLGVIAAAVNSQATNSEKLDVRVRTCEVVAENIGDNLEMDELKQSSSPLQHDGLRSISSPGDNVLRRVESLEAAQDVLVARLDEASQMEDVVTVTRLNNVEERMEDLASAEYVESLVKSLEEGRNQFISKTVERTTSFHMEMTKKELTQRQAGRISEIEGKLEGLRILVTGLVKSVETRDEELTQMNKCYFDELQQNVNETSEELRNTFTEFKMIKRKFEEQDALMSIYGQSTSSETTGEIARKLNILENRVDHVVDKLVELTDSSPAPPQPKPEDAVAEVEQ